MPNVKLGLKYSDIADREIMKYDKQIKSIHQKLKEMSSDKNEFVGWIKLPTKYDKKEFERIKKLSQKIRKDSEVFLVIGIGGSYLGARAVIESLTSSFANILTSEQRKSPQIFFVGNNISPNYLNELIEAIRK